MKKREFLAAGGAVPLMLAGCGSSSSGSAQIRLANVSVGYPTLDLQVSTTTEASGVAYGAVSEFASVSASSVSTVLVDSTATPAVTVSTQTRTLLKDNNYTVVAYGYQNAAKSVLITENQSAPASGFASISVLHTATDVGLIDVYFTQTSNIIAASPVASRVQPVSASSFSSIATGTYVVTIVAYGTGANAQPDLRLQITGVTLSDQQIATLIVAPGSGGVLAHAVLLNQGGSATSYLNQFARVRAIAATGNGGTVAVSNVLGNTVSPGFGDYLQIPAGPAPAVTVDGATVSYSGTVAAGGDYTVLVYGDHTAPLATLITDDNRLPSTTTAAKVRLLNGVFNNTAPLNLKVNSVTVASSVTYGTASAYTETTASTSSNVEVKAGFNSIVNDTLNIVAGNIYTMVMAGDETALPDYGAVVYDFSAAR